MRYRYIGNHGVCHYLSLVWVLRKLWSVWWSNISYIFMSVWQLINNVEINSLVTDTNENLYSIVHLFYFICSVCTLHKTVELKVENNNDLYDKWFKTDTHIKICVFMCWFCSSSTQWNSRMWNSITDISLW